MASIPLLFWLLALGVPSFALDRNAFVFSRTDLQITLNPPQQELAAEGALELRNISGRSQTETALQISSSLHWLSLLVEGAEVEWLSQSYTSDIDHTGLLSEAIVKFQQPVLPGGTVRLTVRYSGTVGRDTTRLERIGTPRELAERSDWDQIGGSFTALRGAGYVVWYPVGMDAASLSRGNEVFEALRDWRERQSAAVLRVRLQVAAGQDNGSQSILVGNGTDIGPPSTRDASGRNPATLDQEFRGAEPVIAMLTNSGSISNRPAVEAYYTAAHTSLARDYVIAAEAVIPALEEWFGKTRSKVVVVVELTDPQALPYSAGRFYFTPMRKLSPAAMELEMARTVAGAAFASARPWVSEGLAGFAQALVRERQAGRGAALQLLGQWGRALAQAEAQSQVKAPPHAAGDDADLPAPGPQPLIITADEIFLRTKSAYVWWMLRDMVGDRALQAALAAYRAADDRDSGYVQRLIEQHLSPRLPQPGSLETFFDDWVYRDRGLPRLRVVSAYTRTTLGQQTVTAVTVKNQGDAGCEVPVMIRSAGAEARARLLVPANSQAIIRLPLDAAPREAEVNDGSVPEALPDNPSPDGHVLPVTTSPAPVR